MVLILWLSNLLFLRLPHCESLGQNVLNHLSMDVGESTIEAVVTIGELLVVDAQKMQDRCVKVMDGDNVLDGFVSKVVGGTERKWSLNTGTGQPCRESLDVVVAAGRF